MGHLMPVEQDAALVGAHEAGDHVENRGLARAIGSEQPDRFAAPHHKAHILDHLTSAIALAKVEDAKSAFSIQVL